MKTVETESSSDRVEELPAEPATHPAHGAELASATKALADNETYAAPQVELARARRALSASESLARALQAALKAQTAAHTAGRAVKDAELARKDAELARKDLELALKIDCLTAAEAQLSQMRHAAAALEIALQQLTTSTSWRITAPLRWIRRAAHLLLWQSCRPLGAAENQSSHSADCAKLDHQQHSNGSAVTPESDEALSKLSLHSRRIYAKLRLGMQQRRKQDWG